MIIRLYIVDDGDGQVLAIDEATARSEKLTDEEMTEAFEGKGGWHEIELHPATHGLQEEAKRAALRDDDSGGFQLDLSRLPAARAAVMVKRWPDKWGPVSAASFEMLHPNIANLLDTSIVNATYPSILQHEGFMTALKRKQQSSEAKAGELLS